MWPGKYIAGRRISPPLFSPELLLCACWRHTSQTKEDEAVRGHQHSSAEAGSATTSSRFLAASSLPQNGRAILTSPPSTSAFRKADPPAGKRGGHHGNKSTPLRLFELLAWKGTARHRKANERLSIPNHDNSGGVYDYIDGVEGQNASAGEDDDYPYSKIHIAEGKRGISKLAKSEKKANTSSTFIRGHRVLHDGKPRGKFLSTKPSSTAARTPQQNRGEPQEPLYMSASQTYSHTYAGGSEDPYSSIVSGPARQMRSTTADRQQGANNNHSAQACNDSTSSLYADGAGYARVRDDHSPRIVDGKGGVVASAAGPSNSSTYPTKLRREPKIVSSSNGQLYTGILKTPASKRQIIALPPPKAPRTFLPPAIPPRQPPLVSPHLSATVYPAPASCSQPQRPSNPMGIGSVEQGTEESGSGSILYGMRGGENRVDYGEEVSVGGGSSRNPSYRYLTVRESVDAIRERLLRQTQQENTEMPAIRDHYYSTITNEYESLGGDSLNGYSLYYEPLQLPLSERKDPRSVAPPEQHQQRVATGSTIALAGDLLSEDGVAHNSTISSSSNARPPSPPQPPTSPIPIRESMLPAVRQIDHEDRSLSPSYHPNHPIHTAASTAPRQLGITPALSPGKSQSISLNDPTHTRFSNPASSSRVSVEKKGSFEDLKIGPIHPTGSNFLQQRPARDDALSNGGTLLNGNYLPLRHSDIGTQTAPPTLIPIRVHHRQSLQKSQAHNFRVREMSEASTQTTTAKYRTSIAVPSTNNTPRTPGMSGNSSPRRLDLPPTPRGNDYVSTVDLSSERGWPLISSSATSHDSIPAIAGGENIISSSSARSSGIH